MNKIELIEHCFGPIVRIDDESIHYDEEYDNRTEEYVDSIKMKIINSLMEVRDSLDVRDYYDICQIMTSRNREWVFNEVESSMDDCDQCGNYNHNEVFYKNDIEPK